MNERKVKELIELTELKTNNFLYSVIKNQRFLWRRQTTIQQFFHSFHSNKKINLFIFISAHSRIYELNGMELK